MTNKLKKWLALLLAALLLSGCGAVTENAPEGLAENVTFDDLSYRRPDISEMEQAVAQLEQALNRICLPSTLTRLISDCYDCYNSFETMYTLADIRSCQNVTDEFYSREYAWCLENRPEMQQLVERMYRSCAASAYAPVMEYLFFWDGFVSQYGQQGEQTQTGETYELYRRENQLINQYRSLLAQPSIQIDGQEISYQDYLAEAEGDQLYRALDAFRQQYNPLLSDIYAQLIKLRREQAALLGYDSYEQMQYTLAFERDYSPEQAAGYLEDIKNCLGPFYSAAMAQLPYSRISWDYMDEKELSRILKAAAENMGGCIVDSYNYMTGHGLYDIQLRPYKAGISFQAYLTDFESPFLFLSPYGDQSDVLSFAHEFGHFTDAYINCNAYETIDLAECFSQAMEYLVLFYLDGAVDSETLDDLLLYKVLDTLELYVGQAAIAEFESKVFQLPDEELTAENFNRLFLEIGIQYGLSDGSWPEQGMDWMNVTHLFESPFYVISYPVTNDVALQIFSLEQEGRGQGLEKYLEMLPRDFEGMLPTVEEAGLQSPFAEGRVEDTLHCLERALDLSAPGWGEYAEAS